MNPELLTEETWGECPECGTVWPCSQIKPCCPDCAQKEADKAFWKDISTLNKFENTGYRTPGDW